MTQDEMVAEARRRAEEIRIREGRPVLPERGPFAEMALARGIAPETVRRAVAFIGGTDQSSDFGTLIGPESQERFLRESAAAFARRGLTT